MGARWTSTMSAFSLSAPAPRTAGMRRQMAALDPLVMLLLDKARHSQRNLHGQIFEEPNLCRLCGGTGRSGCVTCGGRGMLGGIWRRSNRWWSCCWPSHFVCSATCTAMRSRCLDSPGSFVETGHQAYLRCGWNGLLVYGDFKKRNTVRLETLVGSK